MVDGPRSRQPIPVRRRRNGEKAGGGGCQSSRNERHVMYVDGDPTGGNIVLAYTINGTTENVTIAWDDDTADVEAAFVADHSEVSSGDVDATGGSLPGTSMIFEFKNNLGNTRIPTPVVTNNLTGGVSPRAIIVVDQPGYPTGVE